MHSERDPGLPVFKFAAASVTASQHLDIGFLPLHSVLHMGGCIRVGGAAGGEGTFLLRKLRPRRAS